ncbi:MAG: DUF975 family protein [Treponema sp.]|nr:DUF975 family protein [Candidatus Treponema scatequi]
MLDISTIKKNAIANLKGRWSIALVATFASGAINFLLTSIEKLLPENGGIKFLFKIFQFVCTAVLSYSICKVCLDLTNKSEPLTFADYTESFADWFKAIKIKLWTLLWTTLWCLLITIPATFIFLLSSGMALLKNFDMNTMDFKEGFNLANSDEFFKDFFTQYIGLAILLIVIIVLILVIFTYKHLQYGQMKFIVQENKNISVRKSMRVSIEYMKGHKGELFGLIFSFIGWIIICCSPAFLKKPLENILDPKVVNLITSLLSIIFFAFLNPYIVTAKANFYKEVRDAALASGKVKPEDLQ